MKCKIIDFLANIKKAESKINEWLETNSNVKIQFVSAPATPPFLFIFYED